MAEKPVFCGAAAASLDARPGQWLGGLPKREEPATELWDEPTVRTLVLRQGSEWLALACLDLYGLNLLSARNLRQRVADELGCDEEAVCIVCTCVSSAPASMRMRGLGDRLEASWLEHVAERTVRCFREAARSLQPAEILQGFCSDASGSAAVTRFIGSDGPVATLSWATGVAPVLGPSCNAISADYFGFLNRAMERWGGVSVHLPGPWSRGFDPAKPPFEASRDGSHEEAARTGLSLAERLARVELQPPRKAQCKARGGGILLPVFDLPDRSTLDELEARLETAKSQAQRDSGSDARWQHLARATEEWIREARRLSGRKDLDSVHVPMWRALLGDHELFALPFEVDLPTMREFSPALVVGCANGALGPLPHRRPSSRSPLEAEIPPHVLYADLHAPIHPMAGTLLSCARNSLVS